MTTIAVGVPSISPRRHLLERALQTVDEQTRLADQVVFEVDVRRNGPAYTRNAILRQVRCEWVAWLDDDDELLPSHLETCLAAALAHDADLVYPWFVRDDGYDPFRVDHRPVFGRVFDDVLRDYILTKNNFIPITVLVRTDVLRSVGGFPLPGADDWPHRTNEDWGCWRRLLRVGAKFHHVPERTWRWQRHGVDRRSNKI